MPAESAPASSDRDHALVQRVLRTGLTVAVLLMAAGLVVDAARSELDAAPVRLGGILRDGEAGDRIMAAGILVLSLTPLVRVATLIAVWARERDRRFVAVGLAVIAVLAASLTLGVA